MAVKVTRRFLVMAMMAALGSRPVSRSLSWRGLKTMRLSGSAGSGSPGWRPGRWRCARLFLGDGEYIEMVLGDVDSDVVLA
jgi:hypothetical protein